MEWIKLTEKNVPDYEVLLADFDKTSMGYGEKSIGYVSFINGYFKATIDNTLINPKVTHFIDIDAFDL